MSPPNPPRNLHGQLLNDQGQPIDGHGRRLDNLGRPTAARIIDQTDNVGFAGFPNVIIAYPSFNDWVAMFDPRNNRGERTNRVMCLDFRARYQKQITTVLKDIAGRASGQALLNETNATEHSITILPIDFVPTSRDWVKYHNNAVVWADSAIRSVMRGMDAGAGGDGSVSTGTGTGSDSEIYFSPGRGRTEGPAANPDETLFHELVHAVRDTQGASATGYQMGKGYSNAEEFAAVVSTNVYLSEKKQTALRANHGYGVLRQPERFLDSPQVPAPGARALLTTFRLQQPRLFAAFAAINRATATFNPFRQLAEETKSASAAHEAKMRAMDWRR